MSKPKEPAPPATPDPGDEGSTVLGMPAFNFDDEPAEPAREPAKPQFEASPFAPTAPATIPQGRPPVVAAPPTVPLGRAPAVTDPGQGGEPIEEQATMLKMAVPASVEEGATMMQARLPPADDGATMMQMAPPAIEEQATMLRAPAPAYEEPAAPAHDPQADQPTMFGAKAPIGLDDDEATVQQKAAPKPRRGRSGAVAALPKPEPVAPDPANATVNLPGRSAEGKKPGVGIQIAVGAMLLLAAVALSVKFLVGPSRPSTSELQMLYPYGEAGGALPNGRSAPRAEDVQFTFVREVDCGGEPCLTYFVAPPNGGFSMEMTVTRKDGRWINMSGK